MTTVQQALAQLQTDLSAIPTRRAGDAALLTVHADVTALAAAIAALSQPIPIPSPTVAAAAPVFLDPGSGSWTDARGLVWSINSATDILQNGSSSIVHGWQSHLGMGINGTFYVLGLDMNVYGWNGAWQIVPYVSATMPLNPAPPPPPPPPPNAFFVSPTGSDSNNGLTRTSPFQTLEKAQTAMAAQQAGGFKTTILMAGTYNRGVTLNLGSADNGTTWQYDPLSGVNTAVLDGGNSIRLMAITGASNITFNGIKFQNSAQGGGGSGSAIEALNGTNITVENCDMGNITASLSNCVRFGNCSGTLFQNNYVHNVTGAGIALYAIGASDVRSGTVQNNVFLNCVTTDNDDGCIYSEIPDGHSAGHLLIQNNFIRDYGHSGGWGFNGIYMDEGANDVTIQNNIIGPPLAGSVGAGSDGAGNDAASMGHADGGHDVIWKNNILDVGSSPATITMVFYWASGYPTNLVNNDMWGNLILYNFAGNSTAHHSGQTGAYIPQFGPGNLGGTQGYIAADFSIGGNGSGGHNANVYHNYGGGQALSSGPTASDSNPQNIDPQITGYLYNIAGGSPVFNSPVNFVDVTAARSAGPPGFIIPSSTNHSNP